MPAINLKKNEVHKLNITLIFEFLYASIKLLIM